MKEKELREHADRIEELENYKEKCEAITRYMRTDKMEGVMAVVAEIGLLIPPEKE